MESSKANSKGSPERKLDPEPIPPKTHFPSIPPKRSPSSAGTTASKMPRDLPDLSHCHSCGGCADDGRQLHLLESQWRVALLCPACLHAVRSASSCSYCFSLIPADGYGERGLLRCHCCSCCVHLACVPLQRGYVALSDLDPASFTCIDCCALPRFHRQRIKSRDPFFSKVLLEDLVREASCEAERRAEAAATAKRKAEEKALAAKRAADLARRALNAVVVKEPALPRVIAEPVLNDEELALQLHLAMNGSQRIVRNHGYRSSGRLIDCKRGRGSCRSNSKDSLSVKVELCTEDRSFAKGLVQSSSLSSDSEKSRQSNHCLSVAPGKEEHESSADNAVNSSGSETPGEVNGVRDPSDGGSGIGGESCDLQLKQMCSTSDRYMKKYSKRKLGLKEMADRKERQLVSCSQMSCLEVSRACSDALYQSSSVAAHSSSFVSLSSCE